MQYTSQPDFSHASAARNGVLLVNLGSPDAPDPASVRRYLAEFLWDPRVVEMARPLWWLILHGIILRLRPARSARKYAAIWLDSGSPLTSITRSQTIALEKLLRRDPLGEEAPETLVEFAMRYGNPSIETVLHRLLDAGVTRLVVLPLYPQYSGTTTGAVFDKVAEVLKRRRWVPDLRFISQYHDHPDYIDACAEHILRAQEEHGEAERMLFSYHGIPERYFRAGDPYFCECQKTSRLIAERLGLPADRWLTTFQSRFGREPWLQPYTDQTLRQLARDGVGSVQVFCPGFAADCLETLEEIDEENREIFLEAGGRRFTYIPALNADPQHVRALDTIIRQGMQGWTQQRRPDEGTYRRVLGLRTAAGFADAPRAAPPPGSDAP